MPNLTVGKFTSAIATVTNSDGSVNLTVPLSTTTGNPSTLRVRVNPNNNREVGVLALAASAGVNAIVQASLPGGTKTASATFVNVATPPNQEGVAFGPWAAESDPPDWMTV